MADEDGRLVAHSLQREALAQVNSISGDASSDRDLPGVARKSMVAGVAAPASSQTRVPKKRLALSLTGRTGKDRSGRTALTASQAALDDANAASGRSSASQHLPSSAPSCDEEIAQCALSIKLHEMSGEEENAGVKHQEDSRRAAAASQPSTRAQSESLSASAPPSPRSVENEDVIADESSANMGEETINVDPLDPQAMIHAEPEYTQDDNEGLDALERAKLELKQKRTKRRLNAVGRGRNRRITVESDDDLTDDASLNNGEDSGVTADINSGSEADSDEVHNVDEHDENESDAIGDDQGSDDDFDILNKTPKADTKAKKRKESIKLAGQTSAGSASTVSKTSTVFAATSRDKRKRASVVIPTPSSTAGRKRNSKPAQTSDDEEDNLDVNDDPNGSDTNDTVLRTVTKNKEQKQILQQPINRPVKKLKSGAGAVPQNTKALVPKTSLHTAPRVSSRPRRAAAAAGAAAMSSASKAEAAPKLTFDFSKAALGPRLTSTMKQQVARQTLSKAFKVPSFVDPSKRPSDLRLGKPVALGMVRRTAIASFALHDHEAENAIILYSPPVRSAHEELELMKKAKLTGTQPAKEVHVVVDPVLGSRLRPHQVEGVRFLYECTTGKTVENAFGCIIADEMGLGKTLQCITLLWTLLRQSPIAGKSTIEKAIIVCPSSLVKNWANELVKWLGVNRVSPLACDGKGGKQEITKSLERYTHATGRSIVNPVLIISYETLRIYSNILKRSEIGLMLCDEGHRLKNADSQTYQALNALQVTRRVIMSGTPIQNDLTEYFALLNFCNPGLLGTDSEFRKNFELPILRGRDADATDKDREISEQKLQELYDLANKVIIRRTAELLTLYLPIKYEHVVFCRFTDSQRDMYKHFVTSPEIRKLMTGNGSQPLKAITLLKKLCNHPFLLEGRDFEYISQFLPESYSIKAVHAELSGKMLLLERMLKRMRATSRDKIVLISNYTQTLDVFQKMCQVNGWGCVRLDGSMTIQKRGKIVEQFNNPESPEFVFLLSSKAGGCGLNLIGANRLILFDPSWNPAEDQQALARVWRDGQKKTCFIYRFIATGSIEEKILMRQAHKQALSTCVVDEDQDVERHFSLKELRQLFHLKEDTLSEMHDTFKCKRCVNGRQVIKPVEKEINAGAGAQDASTWNHFSEIELVKAHDDLLRETGKGLVTYVFQNKSHERVLKRD